MRIRWPTKPWKEQRDVMQTTLANNTMKQYHKELKVPILTRDRDFRMESNSRDKWNRLIATIIVIMTRTRHVLKPRGLDYCTSRASYYKWGAGSFIIFAHERLIDIMSQQDGMSSKYCDVLLPHKVNRSSSSRGRMMIGSFHELVYDVSDTGLSTLTCGGFGLRWDVPIIISCFPPHLLYYQIWGLKYHSKEVLCSSIPNFKSSVRIFSRVTDATREHFHPAVMDSNSGLDEPFFYTRHGLHQVIHGLCRLKRRFHEMEWDLRDMEQRREE